MQPVESCKCTVRAALKPWVPGGVHTSQTVHGERVVEEHGGTGVAVGIDGSEIC